MVERLEDQRKANAPDESDREYDISNNRKDAVDYMVARYQGEEFEDVEVEAPDEAA